jgi:hypothetical protein
VIVVFAVVRHGADAISWDFVTKSAPAGVAPAIVGSAVIVGIVLLATPPDEKPRNGTLDPFTVSTQHRRNPGGFSPSGAGFSF